MTGRPTVMEELRARASHWLVPSLPQPPNSTGWLPLSNTQKLHFPPLPEEGDVKPPSHPTVTVLSDRLLFRRLPLKG